MKYNIWNKWDPLKVCMLGNNYAPEFFDGCDPKASDPLKRICEETLEDLEGFKEILQDFGVKVIQPEMDPNERFLDNVHRYPRGPLQPRDAMLVLGNDCYISNRDHPAIEQSLEQYAPTIKISDTKGLPYTTAEKYAKVQGVDYPDYADYIANKNNKNYFTPEVYQALLSNTDLYTPLRLNSAAAMMVQDRLVVGGLEPGYGSLDSDTMHQLFPETKHFDVEWTQIYGHSDGQFHPIKPGVIISLHDVQNYSETFPGWEVCYLPDQGLQNDNLRQFKKLKRKNDGKWWLIGEEDNDEFTNFVESWLQDWVGYVEETVFDVNVLMLDEHHCCVSQQNNEQVNAFLKKHNIEPVYIPWRHRFFWDGGLHCITLDLVRG